MDILLVDNTELFPKLDHHFAELNQLCKMVNLLYCWQEVTIFTILHGS